MRVPASQDMVSQLGPCDALLYADNERTPMRTQGELPVSPITACGTKYDPWQMQIPVRDESVYVCRWHCWKTMVAVRNLIYLACDLPGEQYPVPICYYEVALDNEYLTSKMQNAIYKIRQLMSF